MERTLKLDDQEQILVTMALNSYARKLNDRRQMLDMIVERRALTGKTDEEVEEMERTIAGLREQIAKCDGIVKRL